MIHDDTVTLYHILSLLNIHIFELLHAFVAYEAIGKETEEGKGTQYRLCAIMIYYFLVIFVIIQQKFFVLSSLKELIHHFLFPNNFTHPPSLFPHLF